jgi:Icc-related predicted phosphoesterase
MRVRPPSSRGAAAGGEDGKAFVRHTRERADAIDEELAGLGSDLSILLLHYAPVRETLAGEPPEIFPFLGSYLFAEVADRHGANLIVHGHAHRGVERGATRGGTSVRNVAQPVLRRPYAVYEFDPSALLDRSAPLDRSALLDRSSRVTSADAERFA